MQTLATEIQSGDPAESACHTAPDRPLIGRGCLSQQPRRLSYPRLLSFPSLSSSFTLPQLSHSIFLFHHSYYGLSPLAEYDLDSTLFLLFCFRCDLRSPFPLIPLSNGL